MRLKGEGVIKGGVQFAGNSKERARGGHGGARSVESNDQSAGPRCVFVHACVRVEGEVAMAMSIAR